MERLCIIQLNMGDPRVTAVEAHFPYYFSSTMCLLHMALVMLVLFSFLAVRGKIKGIPDSACYGLSAPWHRWRSSTLLVVDPQPRSASQFSLTSIRNPLVFWLSCLLLFQKSPLFSAPAMYRLDFSVEKCKGRHGTHLPLLRQSRRKMVTTSAQEADFHSGFP